MRMWQGIIAITLLGLSPSIFACDLHYYSSGIEVSGSHLVNLTHPKFVTTAVGNKTNVVITYSRSEQNDSAVIELIGTKNIHFDKQRHVLSERSGEVAIGFTLNLFGFALVKMKVHGKQNG